MDDTFKKLLNSNKSLGNKKSYAQDLFTPAFFKQKNPSEDLKIMQKTEFSEKKHVLESLERFAMDQAAEKKTRIINIEGGEIHIKDIPGWDNISEFKNFKQSALIQEYLNNVPNKNIPLDLLFVTDEIIKPNLDKKSELDYFFAPSTAAMFYKMRQAMKLEYEKTMIIPVYDQDQDHLPMVISLINSYQPKVVVSLGARATSALLLDKQRLSQIHGQFFDRKVGEFQFKLCPLLHPNIFENNITMKKLTWTDIQKIMQYLGKI